MNKSSITKYEAKYSKKYIYKLTLMFYCLLLIRTLLLTTKWMSKSQETKVFSPYGFLFKILFKY